MIAEGDKAEVAWIYAVYCVIHDQGVGTGTWVKGTSNARKFLLRSADFQKGAPLVNTLLRSLDSVVPGGGFSAVARAVVSGPLCQTFVL